MTNRHLLVKFGHLVLKNLCYNYWSGGKQKLKVLIMVKLGFKANRAKIRKLRILR